MRWPWLSAAERRLIEELDRRISALEEAVARLGREDETR